MPIDTRFWRLHTLRLHGSWLWELQNHRRSFASANWKALLQTLTRARLEILMGAKPYWNDRPAAMNGETEKEGDGHAGSAVLSLPLGLTNRQRIWMCLECVGVNGT